MSTFVIHEPCPKCKSRDNLARYSDGSAWCFGCGYYEKSNSHITRFTHSPIQSSAVVGGTPPQSNTLNTHIKWCNKYGLTIKEIEQHGIYTDIYNNIVFPFFIEKDLVGYLLRTSNQKRKYIAKGNKLQMSIASLQNTQEIGRAHV